MPTTFNFNYYPGSPIPSAGTIFWYDTAIIALVVIVPILAFANIIPLTRRIMGITIVVAGFLATLGVFYRTYADGTLPVFAPNTMLQSLWTNYKISYIDPASGRTIDPSRNNITTSEGESYTLLRAVWIDDRQTFDASWHWTATHLQRSDHLFSWLYGTRSDGTQGILTAELGQNSASDADTDIALALIFAYSRWQDPAYLRAALPVVRSIWNNEVFTANGEYYLASANIAVPSAPSELVNPSYISPYAYRIFGMLDPTDHWQALTDSSYRLFDNAVGPPLDKATSAYLPPDWVRVDKASGAVSAPDNAKDATQTTNFGYDALRVPWRIALDWAWYRDPRDLELLRKFGFLSDEWSRRGALHAIYGHDGSVIASNESPSMYGGTVGYFLATDPAAAAAIYARKLQSLYDPDTQTWRLPLGYYDANIVWFGMGLYNGALTDLFALNLSSSTPSSP